MNKKKFNKLNKSMKYFCTQDVRNFANEKVALARQSVILLLTFLALGITSSLLKVLADDQSIPQKALDMMMYLSLGVMIPIGFFGVYLIASARNIYKYLFLKESEASK